MKIYLFGLATIVFLFMSCSTPSNSSINKINIEFSKDLQNDGYELLDYSLNKSSDGGIVVSYFLFNKPLYKEPIYYLNCYDKKGKIFDSKRLTFDNINDNQNFYEVGEVPTPSTDNRSYCYRYKGEIPLDIVGHISFSPKLKNTF